MARSKPYSCEGEKTCSDVADVRLISVSSPIPIKNQRHPHADGMIGDLCTLQEVNTLAIELKVDARPTYELGESDFTKRTVT